MIPFGGGAATGSGLSEEREREIRAREGFTLDPAERRDLLSEIDRLRADQDELTAALLPCETCNHGTQAHSMADEDGAPGPCMWEGCGCVEYRGIAFQRFVSRRVEAEQEIDRLRADLAKAQEELETRPGSLFAAWQQEVLRAADLEIEVERLRRAGNALADEAQEILQTTFPDEWEDARAALAAWRSLVARTDSGSDQ